LISYYGYSDGSGDYYIVIDTEKCNSCAKCVQQCPQSALEMVKEFIDLEDKTVVAVKEQHRKNVKYTCSACKPDIQKTPCLLACEKKAIQCIWKSK
jgi:Fe-S-cluster-containing hydrogenase component 2